MRVLAVGRAEPPASCLLAELCAKQECPQIIPLIPSLTETCLIPRGETHFCVTSQLRLCLAGILLLAQGHISSSNLDEGLFCCLLCHPGVKQEKKNVNNPNMYHTLGKYALAAFQHEDFQKLYLSRSCKCKCCHSFS